MSLPGGGLVAPLLQAAAALVALVTQLWQEPGGFIVPDHGLVDGNKRLALASTVLRVGDRSFTLDTPHDEALT